MKEMTQLTQTFIGKRHTHRNIFIGNLIYRALLFRDLEEDLIDELKLLRDDFVSNGYPYKPIQ